LKLEIFQLWHNEINLSNNRNNCCSLCNSKKYNNLEMEINLTQILIALFSTVATIFTFIIKLQNDSKKKKITSERIANELHTRISASENINTENIAKIDRCIIGIKKSIEHQKGRIETLSNTSFDISERLKHENYPNLINNAIFDTLDNVIVEELIIDNNIILMLEKTKASAFEVFKYIIDRQFDVTEIQIRNQLKIAQRKVSAFIDYERLNVKLKFHNNFKENVIIPSTDNFINSFKELENLENGIRRRKFMNICLNFTETIFKKTVEKIKEFQK